MEVNGRNSCTGNSSHVKIRYFFTKDLVDKKEIRIEYCPSERILSDYNTKPLQGELFHIFRSVIMGWEPISTLNKVVLPSKERVDQCKNLRGWMTLPHNHSLKMDKRSLLNQKTSHTTT